MTKRPDQHNLDQNEAQATDYKFRRQSEDQNRRGPDTETVEQGRGSSMTPAETLDVRREQSEQDRERELERAAGVRERGEGNHPSSSEKDEPEGDRSDLRTTGAEAGEGTEESLGESGRRSHDQSTSEQTERDERREREGRENDQR